jgi:hypothetical protein
MSHKIHGGVPCIRAERADRRTYICACIHAPRETGHGRCQVDTRDLSLTPRIRCVCTTFLLGWKQCHTREHGRERTYGGRGCKYTSIQVLRILLGTGIRQRGGCRPLLFTLSCPSINQLRSKLAGLLAYSSLGSCDRIGVGTRPANHEVAFSPSPGNTPISLNSRIQRSTVSDTTHASTNHTGQAAIYPTGLYVTSKWYVPSSGQYVPVRTSSRRRATPRGHSAKSWVAAVTSLFLSLWWTLRGKMRQHTARPQVRSGVCHASHGRRFVCVRSSGHRWRQPRYTERICAVSPKRACAAHMWCVSTITTTVRGGFQPGTQGGSLNCTGPVFYEPHAR